MLTAFRFDDLGKFKNEWLNARYHFSFADYHNADRMGFGPLRVINDDIIAAGSGFGMHPHRDMEIITYVRKGAVVHRDNMGHEGRTEAGDVQVMSAGRGIVHGEKSDPEQDTQLYQIWIMPREPGVAPRWDQKKFPKTPVTEGLNLLVSGRAEDEGRDALMIHQDAAIYGGRLAKGTEIRHKLRGNAYVLMSQGRGVINGVALNEGDGAEITDEIELSIFADSDIEVLVIEL